MEPNRFFDTPIKLLINHYEKQAYGFVTVENYMKNSNTRDSASNLAGQRLMVRVSEVVEFA